MMNLHASDFSVPVTAVCLLLGVMWLTSAWPAPGDIQFKRAEGASGEMSFPPAVFPHWKHRINYRCDACHDRIFKMESGANEISMPLMARGESCGECHDAVTVQ